MNVGSFLKDITGNSSINNLGSKIKNISQNTSWLPAETKDMLATAASSITAATSGSSSNNPLGGSESKRQSSNNLSEGMGPQIKTPSQRPSQSPQRPQQPQTPSSSSSGYESQYLSRSKEEDQFQNKKKQPYPIPQQQTQSRPVPIPQAQQQQKQQPRPPPTIHTKQPSPDSPEPPTPMPPVTRQASSTASGPTHSAPTSHHPTTHTQPLKQPQIPSDAHHQQQQQQQQQSSMNIISTSPNNQIDPLQYNALFETNQALKNELQRLSLFELKCKTLEKEAKNAKILRETNEKLEKQVKELQEELNNAKNKINSNEILLKQQQQILQQQKQIDSENEKNTIHHTTTTTTTTPNPNTVSLEKYEKLEEELNRVIESKKSEEDRFKTIHKQQEEHIERLEIENANLKNKIIDMDRLVEEYERNYNALKVKEQALEKQNKNLENELDRLSERSTNDEMHGQKLTAIEQANRILEEELEQLKEQQKQERAKVKEKMDLLASKQTEKLKKQEEVNRSLEEQLARMKQEENSTIQLFQKQCEELRKRVNELESYESANVDLQQSIQQLKTDVDKQKNQCAEEKKRCEQEKRNFSGLSADYQAINEKMLSISRKHEEEVTELENRLIEMKNILEKKEHELADLKKTKEAETGNFLSKLSNLNDENLNLANQVKNLNASALNKEDEMNKLKKRVNDISTENEKLQSQLNLYQNLENELVDVHMKHSSAQEKINDLEARCNDWEKKYNSDVNEYKSLNQQYENQIKHLKQQLTAEQLKVENISADCALLKIELNKLDNLRARCEHLERELNEARHAKLEKLNEYETTSRKYYETSDKYENEIKLLNAQLITMKNDLKVKEQECKQMEKLFEAERHKTNSLIKQLDELNHLNTQLTMQNSDAKRRLVSLELLTDECNQLRKNLTLMTIESESRKAEISTLNSQIAILEGTIKSLRDTSEKHSHLEHSYETTAYELKKKQEDYKRLQQLHDTVKKEQLDTIELLEEKLRDVEKKTELQALKHEEILLELESIRARRDRLLPLCPNCSTQTIAMYQPMNQPNSSVTMGNSNISCGLNQHSRSQSPQAPLLQVNSQPSPQMTSTQSHHHHHHHQQSQSHQASPVPQSQLLSISIPQTGSLPTTFISPSIISPVPTHLAQLQLITLAGKQSVTVECQTSPTGLSDTNILSKFDAAKKQQLQQSLLEQHQLQLQQQQQQLQQQQYQQQQQLLNEIKSTFIIPKINASSQTDIQKKLQENKEVNTDPIDYKSFIPKPQQTIQIATQATMTTITKSTKNQAVNVNLYQEKTVSMGTQVQLPPLVPPPPPPQPLPPQAPPTPQKVYEEKAIQSILEQAPPPKQKYFLYTCKYSYDPFKMSPNDNPEAELPLLAGDYLFILSEEDEDGFYTGELLNTRRGLVPSNFVERINLDQNNINKYLQSLPKNVLSNTKFSECLNQYNLDAGQLALAAQQIIQKLQTVNEQQLQANTAMQQQAAAATAAAQAATAAAAAQAAQPATKQPLVLKATSSGSNYDKIAMASSTGDINDMTTSTSSVKIGLPYPNNLKVEKRSESSVLVSWEPPTAPISLNQSLDADNLAASSATGSGANYDLNEQLIAVQTYNIYLNQELLSVINGNEEKSAIIEDIDLSVPNRISIQAITSKGGLSKPQECTLLLGSNRSFAPSNLAVHNLTQTSAIVSWWPSSSSFSHIISIDSIEHRTLKPGIYKFKLSGLLPDTSHLVTVTAQIPNHTNESSSNYAASVEFRTLASKSLAIPTDLQLEKDPNEPDSCVLSWHPVVAMPNTVSNGIPVGGYSIYLDGVRVHQILNPIASTVSLSSKLLFNGAKLLTIRTLSLDGNAESKDSEPFKLNKNILNTPPTQQQPQPPQITNTPAQLSTADDSRKKSQSRLNLLEPPLQVPQQQSQQQQPTQQSTSLTASNLSINETGFQNQQPKKPAPPLVNEPNKQQLSVPSQQMTTSTTSAEEKKPPIALIKTPALSVNSNLNTTHEFSQSSNTSTSQLNLSQIKKPSGGPSMPLISQIPKISDVNRKKQDTKLNADNDSDLYENNRTSQSQPTQPIIGTVKKQAKSSTIRQGSPGSTNQSSNKSNKPSMKDNNNELVDNSSRTNKNQSSKQNEINKGLKSENFRVFIALFDYDPLKMSPNTDICQEELPFREGQLIKIFGEQDADGFFYGESNGRYGFIPCNMVSEVQVDDPEVVRQLLNDTSNHQTQQKHQQQPHHGANTENINDQKRSKSGTKTTSSNMNTSSKSSKTTKSSHQTSSITGSKSQVKEQSFVPINNYKQQQQQQQNRCVMIALYDYDPQSLSPNVDVDVELPFKTGEIITVIGEMDEDGFYLGELNGKRGLVPSNFLQPLHDQDNQVNNYSMRSADPIKIYVNNGEILVEF